jgi:RNA polymerase-binding protein DksA
MRVGAQTRLAERGNQRQMAQGKKPTKVVEKAPVRRLRTVGSTTRTPVAPKPTEARLKPKDVERFHEQLVEERNRLKLELEEIEARAARALEIEAAGELGEYDDHPADVASETFEREKDLAIAENTAATISKIDNALNKIAKSTYGVCDICNRAIKRARLEAIPYATLCIDCQGRVEIG